MKDLIAQSVLVWQVVPGTLGRSKTDLRSLCGQLCNSSRNVEAVLCTLHSKSTPLILESFCNVRPMTRRRGSSLFWCIQTCLSLLTRGSS